MVFGKYQERINSLEDHYEGVESLYELINRPKCANMLCSGNGMREVSLAAGPQIHVQDKWRLHAGDLTGR